MKTQKENQEPSKGDKVAYYETFQTVKRFKNRIGRETTWRRYSYRLTEFLDYYNENVEETTPDELIKSVKDMPYEDRYETVDIILDYKAHLEECSYRASTIKTSISIIRSFFKHNRAELPSDDQLWKIKAKVAPVRGKLTVEDIRDVILSMNPCYAAVYTSMFMAGLDCDCFVRWNKSGWPQLKESLRINANIHEIPVSGRKATKNLTTFYTYIGKDALDKIRTYVETERGLQDGPIFMNKNGKAVTKSALYLMWHRHLKTLGKIKPKEMGQRNRYGKNLHELRDTFISQFQKSPAGQEAGQYYTGHVLDENNYAKEYENNQDFRIQKYRQGEPYISLFSDTRTFGTVKASEYEERLSKLENERNQWKEMVAAMIAANFKTPDNVPTHPMHQEMMKLLSSQ